MEVGGKCIEAKQVQAYASLLRRHGDSRDLQSGRAAHLEMSRSGYTRDRFLANLLIEMYGKCGNPSAACSVFASIPNKNVFSWTMLIVAHAHNNLSADALRLFQSMDCEGIRPDEFTLASALHACSDLGNLPTAKSLHDRIRALGLLSSVVLQTALIKAYGRSGRVDLARKIFETMEEKEVIPSTAMLTAFAENGDLALAREIFESMLLQGSIPDAVAWSAMITGLTQDGQGAEALLLLRRMDLEGVRPDRFVLVGALDACSMIPALEDGRRIHSRLLQSSLGCCDGVVGNAVINFYAKAGKVGKCREIFRSMKLRNVVAWSSMIAACGQSGDYPAAAEFFLEMQLDGIPPNKVTFVSLLFSCSHAGLLDESIYWLLSMHSDYGVQPLEQHCVCVIDILGRAGRLDEAEKLLRRNSAGFFGSEVVHLVSTSLLGFCKVQGELDRGFGIAERVLELDARCGPSYVSVSNIYATSSPLKR